MLKNRFYMLMDEAGGAGDSGSGSGGEGDASGVVTGQAEGGMKVSVSDATEGGNSASASVSIAGDGSDGQEAEGFDINKAMGDYATDPDFEKFKTEDGFDIQNIAKSYKELQALASQKIGVPNEDSSQEAKDLFYQQLGVPESAEAYGFERPEDFPEQIYDQEHADKWSKIFKENNIPAEAANAIRAEAMKEAVEQFGEMEGDISKSEEEFDKVATELLGEKKTELMEKASVMLQNNVPEEMRADIAKNVPSSVLVAMTKTIIGEVARLTGDSGEDIVLGEEDGEGSSVNVEELRQKAREMMTDPAYNNPMVNKDKHERLRVEVRKIYQKIDAVKKNT